MIKYILNSGVFNIRQALIQTNLSGNMPRVPNVLGIALLVAVFTN
jgi:hypothetical protein